jgi:FemAB-related protein (PEP-CTERM system-associated)
VTLPESRRSRSSPSLGLTIDIHEGPGTGREAQAWDAYVDAHPSATFFHRHGWLDALRALSHRPLRLIARRGDEVRGVLPLCLARGLRGRAALISLPHTVYGGPLAEDGEVERALWSTALDLARAKKAPRIELRNRHPTSLELASEPGYAAFERELPLRAGDLVAGYAKGARAAVGQAERFGLATEWSNDLAAFHRLLAASYRRLGTPVFPLSFLTAIRDRFPEDVALLFVRDGDDLVAGVLSLRFRDSVMPLFSGELPRARRLRANNLKYHRLMTHAIEHGVRRFDFGRSRTSNPGAMAFKRHFGCAAVPLPYQVWPGGGAYGPDPNLGPWLFARALWRSLPAPVADRLGPWVVRRFP